MTNAIIFGASGVLGSAIADAIANQGGSVALGARSAPDASRIDRAISQSVDVRDEASVQRFIEAALARFGTIDLVVIAAAAQPTGPARFLDIDPAEWTRLIDTNYSGAYVVLHTVLPHLTAGATIVLIGCGSAADPVPPLGNIAYGVSKAGLEALSVIARKDGEPRGVRVHLLQPTGDAAADAQTILALRP